MPMASHAERARLNVTRAIEPDARLPHVCCTSDTIDVGLYDRDELRRLTLLFDTDDPEGCILRLGQRGIEPIDGLPATLHGGLAALFVAPEGTPIIIASLTSPIWPMRKYFFV